MRGGELRLQGAAAGKQGLVQARLAHFVGTPGEGGVPFDRLGLEHSGIEGTGVGLAIVRLVALHHRLDDHPGGWSAPAAGSRRSTSRARPAARTARCPPSSGS